MQRQRFLLLGVLLTTLVTLALEIVLTRIFSVTMWYHFAFLTISIALMGSAAAGVMVYLRPQMLAETAARRWMGYTTIALTLAIPICLLLYLQIPSVTIMMNRTESLTAVQILYLALIYVLLSIPFFLSGVVISLALASWVKIAGRIYWADLTGAAIGCLVSVALLQFLGGVNAVLALGVMMGAAALVFNGERPFRQPRFLAAIAALLITTTLLATNLAAPWVQIRVSKGEAAEPNIIYERWNAHSRVTVYEPAAYPFFWAISGQKWEETIQNGGQFHHSLLLIDAVAGTPIQQFDGDFYQVSFLRNDLTALAYHLIDEPTTLVIGPGGGRDVLTALVSGAPMVTAVEVNPAIVAAVKGQFADFAGHLYDRPDVNVQVADARGFVERSADQYDVIQASLIDTWAAGGSGAFALSENSLYTREAFQTYYEHLSDRGMTTVSRWYLPDRPAETLRLVSTAMAGWQAAGVSDPRQHIAVIAHLTAMAQTEGLSTTLLKRTPFTPEEVATLQEVAKSMGYTVLYAPGLAPFEEVGQFIAQPDHATFIANYPLDISPATDDRPFFFNLVLFGDLLDASLSGSGVYRTSMESIFILMAVLAVSLVLALLFILLPLGLSTRRKLLKRPSSWLLAYVGTLGLAFMLVEIPTIQRLTVYLGRPVYSLTVVLFSLLLFSGMGSLWSSTWAANERRIPGQMGRVLPALLVALIFHAIVSSWILQAAIGWSLPLRIGLAVTLLAVLGFFMGIPFPVGIRWAGRQESGGVPWLWAINGVMSVMGSALATALAIHVGFQMTLVVATAVYGLAGFFLLREFSQAASGEFSVEVAAS